MNPPAAAPMEKPSVKMKSVITTTTVPEMKVTGMVTNKSSPLISIKESKIIMPGGYNEQKVDDLPDGSIVLAEGHEAYTWIRPQLCTIRGGKVLLQNKKADPVFLSKNKKSVVKLAPTKLVDINDPETDDNYYNGPNRTVVYKTDEDNHAEIEFSHDCDPEVKKLIELAHEQNRQVFTRTLRKDTNMSANSTGAVVKDPRPTK